MKRKRGLPPVPPGEIIKQDILPSVRLSLTAAAKARIVPVKPVEEVRT